jgi:hypothetical protein
MPRIVFLLCAVFIASCAIDSKHSAGPAPCSPQWFQFVEEKLATGDSEGHGPDLGSSEWRSVVEFKLGVRGDPAVPDRSTGQWCIYIDEMISINGAYPHLESPQERQVMHPSIMISATVLHFVQS